MKTPDEIKKGMECCKQPVCPKDCPYNKPDGICDLTYDMENYILWLEEQVPKWISVKDRLPETDNLNTRDYNVLLWIPKREGCRQNGIYLGKILNVKPDTDGSKKFFGIRTPGSEWTVWGWSYFEEPIPTHWMPLPEPPKED